MDTGGEAGACPHALPVKLEGEEATPVQKTPEGVGFQAQLVCAFVALTGFFHGYDNGVVSDVLVMQSFRDMMGWPSTDDGDVAFQKGITVNGFNIGAAVSAVLCGYLIVDRFGRKPALLTGSLLYAGGGVLQAAAMNALLLIFGRVISGVGVGITSCAGPAYISEMAPAKYRGALVGMYQSNVCLAIVAASLINYLNSEALNGWRWSLGVHVLLGGGTAMGIWLLPDTPRFLQSAGRPELALKVLTRLRGDEAAARRELEVVQLELDAEKEAGSASWMEIVTNPFFRNVVIIGCLTQFFQIMTGINAMVSYGGTLFTSLGVHGLVSSLVPNVAFFVGNAAGSLLLVDRAGRRPLLVWGMLGMGVTMVAGGVAAKLATTYTDTNGEEHVSTNTGYIIITMVVGYMFCFGLSWGFGAWLYISEMMPLRVRGRAVGLCTAVNWGPASMMSAFVTPAMIASEAGPGGTLLFFGAISLLVVPFAATCLPETKGKSLEQITPLFRFSGLHGFSTFVRGNLAGGLGAAKLQVEAASRGELQEGVTAGAKA